jgi:predicted nucleic acid-binding protein
MTEIAFVDSNILVYAYDIDAGVKRTHAGNLIRELLEAGSGRVSAQVLQEFYVTSTQKLRNPLHRQKAREIVGSFGPWVREYTTSATVLRAIDLSELAKISFWDALIVAAAEQSNATILYSEDLNHGQVIAGIKIVNPFVAIIGVKN